MQQREMSLSELLANMRDQFRGYSVVDGQVQIAGPALDALVQTLEQAADAAERLEHELAQERARQRGQVVSFVRHLRREIDRGVRRAPRRFHLPPGNNGNGGDAA